MKALPIGISDFNKILKNNYFYVDKSMLINDLLINGAEVTLFTRPRRFGKTLNMSMLYYFFNIKEAEDNKKLFHGLNIEKTEFWKEQGKYPVIFISFKDINASNWNECYNDIKKLMKNIFKKNLYIYESLDSFDKEDFDLIRKKSKDGDYKFSLKFLSQLLYEYYNKKVIILIDEYDTPIISAYTNRYYDEAIEFFKNFYSTALKDNEFLLFGVMTGITRVAKEGIFSGLNNLDVYTILDEKFADSFGLTESDVNNALNEYKLVDNTADVKEWYNGYKFSNYEIYNPWSIIKYLNTKKLDTYWINTSGNDMINEVLDLSDEHIFGELINLVNNSNTEQYIDKNMTFDSLSIQDSIWTLLLLSGYLTVAEKTEDDLYMLKIPNKEIYSFFKDTFIERFGKKNVGIFKNLLRTLKKCEITGNNSFETYLRKILITNASYYDMGTNEALYHTFILGLLSGLDGEYFNHSNQENGLGRPDMVLEPRDKHLPGFILEFKVVNSLDNIDKKLDEAIKQIEAKEYKAQLSERGITNILGIAIVFHGKELKIKYKSL